MCLCACACVCVCVQVEVGAASSNGDARRLVQQGGVAANNAKVTDAKTQVAGLVVDGVCVVRVGKKRQFIVVVE
jgi:tyrosyl-tRNA synthetase